MDQRLRDISRFVDGIDPVHDSMRKLARVFDEHRIEYVIVGGMAVNAHGYVRTTKDVDFLVRAEGVAVIREKRREDEYEKRNG